MFPTGAGVLTTEADVRSIAHIIARLLLNHKLNKDGRVSTLFDDYEMPIHQVYGFDDSFDKGLPGFRIPAIIDNTTNKPIAFNRCFEKMLSKTRNHRYSTPSAGTAIDSLDFKYD
jgi:hypothetical protein